MLHLSPTFLKRPQDLEKMREIYSRVKDSNNTSFKVALDNEIELFESLMQ